MLTINNVAKAKALQFALNKGASIDINFHDCTKEEAEHIMEELAKITGAETMQEKSNEYQWFKQTSLDFDVAAFYDKEPIAK